MCVLTKLTYMLKLYLCSEMCSLRFSFSSFSALYSVSIDHFLFGSRFQVIHQFSFFLLFFLFRLLFIFRCTIAAVVWIVWEFVSKNCSSSSIWVWIHKQIVYMCAVVPFEIRFTYENLNSVKILLLPLNNLDVDEKPHMHVCAIYQ